MDANCYAVIIAAVFIVMDIVSGLIKGLYQKALSSEKLREGAFHKIGFILVIVLAWVCESAVLHLDLGFDAPLVVPVCTYIALTEIVSIMENIIVINPQLKESKIFDLFEGREK